MEKNNCLICDSVITSKFILNNKTYCYCRNCDFIFLEKNYIISENEEKERYLQHNNTFENKGYVRMFRNFIEDFVLEYLEDKDLILDFGCGSVPVLAGILQAMGKEVVVYDKYFFPDTIEYLSKKYTLIITTETIEHLYNPLEYFKLFKSLLKSSGKIFFTSKFHPSEIEKIKKWWYIQDKTHISLFSKKTILKIADLLNMEVLKIDEEGTGVLKKT